MISGLITYDITPLQGALANAFLILINTLFFNVKLIGQYNQYPEDSASKLLNEEETVFDFIIVGAGAAGCALANRLSEQEQWSVLLIEAGGYPTPGSEVPALYPTFLSSSFDVWQYRLEKDNNFCQAYKDKQCKLTRGKVLGGTSTIYNLHYFRGGDSDNYGNFTDLIFDSLEFYDNDRENDMLKKGEIYLQKANVTSKVKDALIKAYKSIGFDYNSYKSMIGFTDSYLTLKNGERYNMARAFLTPVKNRSNFFFAKNTLVEGIVTTEPVDRRAQGVNVTIDSIKFFLRARKELILTSGAINNAKLLLVSGIGPREYLQQRKIPLVVNVPSVGKNLQMHMTVPVFVGLDPGCEGCISENYKESDLIQDVFDYVMYRTGNLSNTGINDFVTFISTEEYPNEPNVGVYHSFFKIGDRMLNTWLEGLGLNQKSTDTLLKFNDAQPILVFMLTLLKPKSRGEIKLNETHHLSNPNIFPNFFSDSEGEDLKALISGFSLISNLTDSAVFEALGAKFLDINIPECKNYKFCSIHYVRCYVKSMVYPTSDLSGSTRRGPECDKGAAVKHDFEVKYVRCLRVGDSSVLPDITLGNTVATDAMLGVKLSEVLKEKWIRDYVSPYKNVSGME